MIVETSLFICSANQPCVPAYYIGERVGACEQYRTNFTRETKKKRFKRHLLSTSIAIYKVVFQTDKSTLNNLLNS